MAASHSVSKSGGPLATGRKASVEVLSALLRVVLGRFGTCDPVLKLLESFPTIRAGAALGSYLQTGLKKVYIQATLTFAIASAAQQKQVIFLLKAH